MANAALMNGNGMAGWVKAVGTLGSTGALIVIAFYVVYSVVENQPEALTREILETQKVLSHHIQQSEDYNDSLKAILRQICVNTSEDNAQRTACFTRTE